LATAQAAVQLYAEHPAVAFVDLAAEVATEVRLIRAIEAELAIHAAERETAYRWADPGQLARTLPGLGEVGGPVLAAVIGEATRSRPARPAHHRQVAQLVCRQLHPDPGRLRHGRRTVQHGRDSSGRHAGPAGHIDQLRPRAPGGTVGRPVPPQHVLPPVAVTCLRLNPGQVA
jgi:hypothetical protein